MRFLLDMPLSERTAKWLRSLGFDVIHAREIGLARAADPDILKRAADENRIVLTLDLGFPRILYWSRAQRPGVILFRLNDPRPDRVQTRLEFLFRNHTETQLAASVTIIEDHRIRIRTLPLD